MLYVSLITLMFGKVKNSLLSTAVISLTNFNPDYVYKLVLSKIREYSHLTSVP